MSRLIWDRSLSVGVEIMDEQHRLLFQCINDLLDAMEKGAGERERQDVLKGVIEHLLEYTNFHFTAEEELMERYHYPDVQNHRREHHDFIEIIKKMSNAYNAGDHHLSLSVLEFLVGWLKNHILGTDRKYSSFVSDPGT